MCQQNVAWVLVVVVVVDPRSRPLPRRLQTSFLALQQKSARLLAAMVDRALQLYVAMSAWQSAGISLYMPLGKGTLMLYTSIWYYI